MATAIRSDRRNYAANPGDLPRGTLVELFFDAVERLSLSDALRRKVDGQWHSVSHQELLEDVRRLALALESLGIGRGDRLGLLSETRLEWALADYATLAMGGQDVPIYANLPADQIAYIVRDSGARLLFASTAEQFDKVREVWGELPALERVIVFEPVETDDERVMTLEQVLVRGAGEVEAGKGEDFRGRALTAQPDDVATILYTSGTTGRPKGVMLTHNNIFSNVQAAHRALGSVGPGDTALSLLPLCHIFERMIAYFLFWRGCTIAYAESIETVPENLREVRPTIVASVPRLYEKIYARVMAAGGVKGRLVRWAKRVGEEWASARLAGRTPPAGVRLRRALADRLVFRKLRAATGGRLRFFVSGGAPLNPEIGRFFYSAGVLILEGYGLTETSPVTNVNTPQRFRFGTVGQPVVGTEEMIAGDGELLVRGPQVMKGYYDDPEGTRAAIDEDGWFHTGDIGEIDEDGFLRITDRKKDIIVTAGGKNIAPAPIENRAKMSPFVAEAIMVGDRRPYAILVVVPDFERLNAWAAQAGQEVTDDRAKMIADERIREKMEAEVFGQLEGLARYEMPKKILLLEREFGIESGELTPKLSVKRHVVFERVGDRIEALYAEPAPATSETPE